MNHYSRKGIFQVHSLSAVIFILIWGQQGLNSSVFAQQLSYKDLYRTSVRGVVAIYTKTGLGSGFVVNNDGYVATNAHVIGNSNALDIVVVFSDNTSRRCQSITALDSDADVAVVKLSSPYGIPIPIKSGSTLEIGEEICVIGNPSAEAFVSNFAMNRGIISNNKPIAGLPYLIQHDAPTNPGNSGGPMLDLSGFVRGIATSRIEKTQVGQRDVQNINFATNIDELSRLLQMKGINPMQQVVSPKQYIPIIDPSRLPTRVMDYKVPISNDAKRCYNDGNSKLNVSDYASAIQLYTMALRIEKHHYFYYQRGLTYKKAGDLRSAYNDFVECLNIAPAWPNGYVGLAGTLFASGDFFNAKLLYKAAIRIDPDLSVAKEGFASACGAFAQELVQSGEYQEAMKALEEGIYQSRNNYKLYTIIGQVHNKLGKYQDAMFSLKKSALR